MDSDAHIEKYDIVILGSGEAGNYIAWTQATAGKRVALIEKQYVGGSCPNIACLPSKNLVHSAKVAHYLRNAESFGFSSTQASTVDMRVVRERKRAMVQGLVERHQDRFKQTGAEFILGTGQFIAPKTIAVKLDNGTDRTVTGGTVIISTGSRAVIDDTAGLREAEPLTHVEILEMDHVPPHLIILGGGYIGLEFAQIMRRLGSKVTIVERNSHIFKQEDEDISSALQEILIEEGVEISTDTIIKHVEGHSGSSVRLTGTKSGEAYEVHGTHILAATGRIPNTTGIGLEKAGVETTPRSFIKVDEFLNTTVEGVFAVGDCAGSPHFTHIAYDDFRIVREVLSGKKPCRSTTNRQVPYTLFTDPELAHVGLHESEAHKMGIKYQLAKLPMKAFLRTRTLAEMSGFAKALVSNEDDRIIGFTALGVGAGELLAPVQLCMAANLPYTSLKDLIIVHPTFNEGLVYLFSTI